MTPLVAALMRERFGPQSALNAERFTTTYRTRPNRPDKMAA